MVGRCAALGEIMLCAIFLESLRFLILGPRPLLLSCWPFMSMGFRVGGTSSALFSFFLIMSCPYTRRASVAPRTLRVPFLEVSPLAVVELRRVVSLAPCRPRRPPALMGGPSGTSLGGLTTIEGLGGLLRLGGASWEVSSVVACPLGGAIVLRAQTRPRWTGAPSVSCRRCTVCWRPHRLG